MTHEEATQVADRVNDLLAKQDEPEGYYYASVVLDAPVAQGNWRVHVSLEPHEE